MNQEIEVFVKLLEKNFSNQVIDEFLLVKVEKECPSNLKTIDILLEDSRSLLESCFSIWDISSRLLVQDKKNLTSNGKYILRLRLLCCRLIYFIFQSELQTEEAPPKSSKSQGKETIKNIHYHDLPALFHDSDIVQETLKMFVRCAQNCFEVEDTQKLDECLILLASLEENFSISESILKHHQNLQLYLLMNQWILQYYANEDQQIPKSLIKKKFPQLLSLISSANPSLHEKDQIITLILIIVCKLMITSDENNLLGKELASFSLKTLQDYTHLLSNKEDLYQLFQKILIYSSIQQQNSTTPLQLYEKLTACSEDKLTEYLKLLVEVKLKISTNALSKEDMDLLAKKIEFLTSQHDIDPEEFCAFVEELTLISGKNCKGFFLAQFIESISNNVKFKTKKVDLVAIRLVKHWIDKIQTAEEDLINTESLQEHLQIILKSILKDRISSKKLHILEKNMIQLAKLLTLQKSYKLSFDFLENLIEFIRKDRTSMLKEACILQIENCYNLKHPLGAKRAFETYDSLEPDKEEFLYNVCKLKTLITIAMADPDQEAQQLAHEIPLFLSTLIDSKNFDDKTFFLLVIELLQNNLGGGSRLQNQTVMLKEFFIVLRKGLEKVILNHEQYQQQELEKSSFPLFKLFCVYLSHFEELFQKYRGDKTHFSESLIHESIGTTLEIGFLVLETFRIFCEKFVLKSDDSSKTRFLNPTWLFQQSELDYLDNFYWNLAIFVGYLNLDLNFALRFIFLSLKMKLMSIILNNLGLFGDFVGDNNPKDLEINLFLQFCLDRTKEIYIEENMLLSLIKTLLLYVSNTLCLLKNKQNNLIDNTIVLKCLELNQALITNSDSNTKAFSYLQYHSLVEFEYRILVCPETTRMFLDDFCLQTDLDPQLFLVFADIANTLNQKQEYLLCLRTHVRASLKDNATPFLSVECYVELIENSQGIEDKICYLRQLLTFLDDNVQALKSKNTSQDVIQELEYLCAFCQNKNNPQQQNDEKRELYQVEGLLLEEIKEKIDLLVIKDF